MNAILSLAYSFPHRNCNEIKTHLLRAATNLLRCVKVRKITTLETILVTMSTEMQTSNAGSVKPNLSEEFKLSVISCMDAAMRYAIDEVIEQFFVPKNRNIIATILFACKNTIDTEAYRALR